MESYSSQSIIVLGTGLLVIGALLVFIGEYRKLIELDETGLILSFF